MYGNVFYRATLQILWTAALVFSVTAVGQGHRETSYESCPYEANPSLDVSNDDASLLQLSLDQLSDKVVRRGDVGKTAAAAASAGQGSGGEDQASTPNSSRHSKDTEVAAAASANKVNPWVSLPSLAVGMGSWLRFSRLGNILSDIRSAQTGGMSLIAITLVVFLLAGVALLLISSSFFSEKAGDNEVVEPLYPLLPQHGRRSSPGASQRQQPRQLGSPGLASPGQTMTSLSATMSSPGTRTSPIAPSKRLLPELLGAMVPANRKFIVKVPSLLNVPTSHEISQSFQVMTKHGEPMFQLKLLPPIPQESALIEEYFSISLPGEDEKDLLVCTFGRPRGPQRQCEIHKSNGKDQSSLVGIMHEDQSTYGKSGDTSAYTILSTSGERLMTVVVRGDVRDRNIRIVDGSNPTSELACTVPGDAAGSFYQAECYPNTDVVMALIALTATDRLSR